ncbi:MULTISPECIES: methylated-DNA--[protein]-cysteine S-methyltransferase [Streptomyces]|uniref:Methylated-DNA--[protein]-cysteine S-methyltransferase n=1 Tax=Streptomyces sudanensis TaxID=436397 RepID=A0ABY4TE65_9ACTN|nr:MULTISPECIES: methylated-DNA--[protein]-cysteine S-methyltransferase [Streptomyces]MCP9958556.1 methylated-DNA--[protein]-cysteine S-methyltransferase [Streptomyces sudanensis]MCQ0000936.1 methylated-DNA--[protein]-cysteine S-methyltransferase [Streptomyces sudanensis]URN16520.1 methylated-DNA--[protein]-cysteine S-methyltransferase [Streptomyces sudanensis]
MRTSSRPVAPVALTTAVGVHATALGPLVLAATDDALVLCAFDPPEAAAERARRAGLHPVEEAEGTAAQRRVLDEARTQLDAYLSGGRRDFTVPADLRLATPFSRRTVSILEEFVPYGRTTTYARLAEALDRPRAARAVGTALGANPLCVVFPCHRIVGSTGSLSGYAGGLAAKRFLLDLETAARPPL